jgi:hypothetical protein
LLSLAQKLLEKPTQVATTDLRESVEIAAGASAFGRNRVPAPDCLLPVRLGRRMSAAAETCHSMVFPATDRFTSNRPFV